MCILYCNGFLCNFQSLIQASKWHKQGTSKDLQGPSHVTLVHYFLFLLPNSPCSLPSFPDSFSLSHLPSNLPLSDPTSSAFVPFLPLAASAQLCSGSCQVQFFFNREMARNSGRELRFPLCLTPLPLSLILATPIFSPFPASFPLPTYQPTYLYLPSFSSFFSPPPTREPFQRRAMAELYGVGLGPVVWRRTCKDFFGEDLCFFCPPPHYFLLAVPISSAFFATFSPNTHPLFICPLIFNYIYYLFTLGVF